MAVTVTLAGSNTYFSTTTHIHASVWAAFSDNQKTAAIAQALRILNRTFDLAIATDETVDADDFYQPDYAVYEEALWLLVNSDAIPNGEQSGAKFLTLTAGGKNKKQQVGLIAPEAKAWLLIPPDAIYVIRG